MVSIPGGTFLQTQQSYNDKNQLTSKYWKMWAQVYGDSYTYNTDGSLNTMATASGANLQYHYDHLRRVSSITSNLWGTMDFYTKTYSYRDISATQTTTQVSSVAYTKLANPITFGYTYDAVGNVLTHSQTGEGTITYTYDNQGQLLKAAGDTTYTYTYDNVGNILTASNGTTTHTYTYGDANWKDLLTKFDGVSITYDGVGNPLAYYNGTNWTYTWAAGRRLMSAVSGGNTINFSYNEDGSRASKTVNGLRHNYTWDGQTLVRDYYGSTILDFSYDASGRPYAMHYNSTPYFYILNLQGDVIRMVDGNGNTVASYEYDPYGKVISATGWLADINPIRYRGYYYDQETGLYHLWSRYYDPLTGRFISADKYTSTGQDMLGYNMFAYCRNNPISRKDAMGTDDVCVTDVNDDDNPLNDVGTYYRPGGATATGGNGGSTTGGNTGGNTTGGNAGNTTSVGGTQDSLLPNSFYSKHAPKQSTPNSSYTNYTYNYHTGKFEKSTAYYDYAGRQCIRIDWTNHGYSDHGNPHVHYTIYNWLYRDGISTRWD